MMGLSVSYNNGYNYNSKKNGKHLETKSYNRNSPYSKSDIGEYLLDSKKYVSVRRGISGFLMSTRLVLDETFHKEILNMRLENARRAFHEGLIDEYTSKIRQIEAVYKYNLNIYNMKSSTKEIFLSEMEMFVNSIQAHEEYNDFLRSIGVDPLIVTTRKLR